MTARALRSAPLPVRALVASSARRGATATSTSTTTSSRELDEEALAAALFDDERKLHEAVLAFLAFVGRSTGTENEAALQRQLRQILNVSGKRVRPLFPFWLLRAKGIGADHTVVAAIARVAAVTLVLHSAAIVIDDIEDGSTERQSLTALHLRNGLAPTLNSASLLIFAALEYLGDSHLCMLALNAVTRCHVGQAIDLGFGDPTVAAELLAATSLERSERWLQCTRGKTSQLMSLSLRGAAHVLGLPLYATAGLANAISDYGVGYQMLDDIKNFRPDLLGKKAYEDLPHALRNWVCLELFATLSADELATVQTIYDTPVLQQFILLHPGLPAALENASVEAERYVQRASAALLALTDGRERAYLSSLLGRPLDDLRSVHE